MYYIALLLTVAKKQVCAPMAHKIIYILWNYNWIVIMLRDTLFFYKAKCINATLHVVELNIFGRITILL